MADTAPIDLAPEIDFQPESAGAPAFGGGFELDKDEQVTTPASTDGTAPADDKPAEPETPGEETKPTDTPPAVTVADGKVKVGDIEYSLEDLPGLLEKGTNVAEQQKAATQKFQEAADLRKEVESQFSELKAMGEYLAGFPQEALDELMELSKTVEAKYKGGKAPAAGTTPSPGPNALQPIQPLNIPGLDDIDREELPEGPARVMYDAVKLLAGQNAQLAQAYAVLHGQVGEVNTVLPEVSNFIKGTKVDAEAQATAAQILKETGLAVTSEDLREAAKTTGVANLHAAWLLANRDKLAQTAANAAAASKLKKPIGPPDGSTKTFDPKLEPNAEAIFAKLNAGMTPVSS